MSYTPGPWRNSFKFNNEGHIHADGTPRLATVLLKHCSTNEHRANIHLITCAPELLECLEKLVKSLEWEEKKSGTTYAGYDDAKKVIAKARGE